MPIKAIKDKNGVLYPYDTVEDLPTQLGLKWFEIDRMMNDETYRNRLGLSIELLTVDNDNAKQKKVRCIETNEEYSSPKKCAEHIGCTISTLSRALNGRTKTVHGRHYQYVKEYLDIKDNIPIPGYEDRYVFNLATERVFSVVRHGDQLEMQGVIKVDDTGRQKRRVELWKNGKRKRMTIEDIKGELQCVTKFGRLRA